MNTFYPIRCLLLSAGLLFCLEVKACDACGCVSPSAMGGLLPVMRSSVLGVRVHFRQFNHPLNPPNMNGESQVIQDRIIQTAVWLRSFPLPKWQLYVEMPYSIQQRQETMQNIQVNGPGDAQVAVSYLAVNTPDSLHRRIKTAVLIGLQTSLPTGHYQLRDVQGKLLPLGLQSGTGSWGIGPHVNASIRHRVWGLNLDLRYSIFSKNERGLQPGGAGTGSIRAFAFLKGKRATVLPSVGILGEWLGEERLYNAINQDSGGQRMSLQTGVELFWGKLFAASHLQWAVWESQPQTQPRLLGSASVSLGYVW